MKDNVCMLNHLGKCQLPNGPALKKKEENIVAKGKHVFTILLSTLLYVWKFYKRSWEMKTDFENTTRTILKTYQASESEYSPLQLN